MYLVQSRVNPGFRRGGMYFPYGIDKEVPETLMTPEIMGEPLLWIRWHVNPGESQEAPPVKDVFEPDDEPVAPKRKYKPRAKTTTRRPRKVQS
mgnify:CR=1 FL=1